MLEELRLEADIYRGMHDRALLGLLAEREAGRRRQRIDRTALRHALGRLRARHGLFARADLERWLAANGMAPERLDTCSRIRSGSRRSGRWPNPACAIACSTSCAFAATMRGSRLAAGTSRSG